jgi:hypothetical protein
MKRFILIQVFVVFFCLSHEARAQKYEVHPYGGGFFAQKLAGVVDVDNGGLFGIKSGVFITSSIEAVGNVGYMPALTLGSSLTRKSALVLEGLMAYNFTRVPAVYASVGIGGLRAKDRSSYWGSPISSTDTFLTVSYGGGLKFLNKWGPLGYRADVRGRTIPNFYGYRLTFLETTAGLTFSWGER